MTTVDTDRRKYLGGSDAAAVFGVSPWKTKLDLFLDKVKPYSDIDTTDPDKLKFFARRKRQEPVVAEMLTDEYGIEVTTLSLDDHPNRYRDAEHRFMAAEIDFEFRMTDRVREHFPSRDDFNAIPNGALLNGEIKTVHPFAASQWGEQGSEDVPIHIAAQVMHGLGVTKRPAAIVAALFGLDTLSCFPVMADAETITAMRSECVKFWNENVLARVPPEPVNMNDIRRLYTGFGGKPCHLSEEAFDFLRNIERLRETRRILDDDIAECEWRVAKFIADAWGRPLINDDGKLSLDVNDNALLMLDGVEVGSWNRQRGAALDQRRLRADHPEIVKAYMREHHYRAFRLKKPKGAK